MRGYSPTRDGTKLAFIGADFGRRCASAGVRATGSGGLATTAGDELSDDDVETAGDIA